MRFPGKLHGIYDTLWKRTEEFFIIIQHYHGQKYGISVDA
jgi:hypothetical protein